MKLVLLDLDGTLLTSTHTILDENVRALRRLKDRGIRVSFATGRPPQSSLRYARLVEPNAPLVHMNGGLVRDWRTAEVHFRRHVERSVAARALAAGHEHALHANVYVDEEIWIRARSATSAESEAKDGVAHVVVGDIAARLESSGNHPLKIMFVADPARIPALADALSAAVGERASLVNSEPTYLEVLPAGVTKREGARALVAHLGISMKDVVAFGDNKNDIELLEDVGLGVAMGNAHPHVLARIGTHIGDHDSPAIARFLDAL